MLRPEDCKPGTLVECIDDAPGWHGIPYMLRRGAIYTIKEFAGQDCLGDFGIVVHEAGCASGEAFRVARFRLLPDSRLEVFRALLAPIRTKDPHPCRP